MPLKNLESKSNITVSSRRSYLKILSIILVILFFPISLGEVGRAVELERNINLMLVSDGYHSIFTEIIDRVGLSFIPSDNSDRYKENVDGYGFAESFYKKRDINSLFLTVPKWSIGYKNGLRSHDVLYKIIFLNNCKDNNDPIRQKWVDMYKCDSILFLNREGKNIVLKMKRDGNRWAGAINSKGDYSPKLPYQLNNVTGLSGGLSLSLYYLDSMSNGSLFSNDRVSATGAVWASANIIDTISGLDKKLEAAIKNNSTLFLIPENQDISVIKGIKIPKSLKIYRVKTLEDAVNILCSRGSNDTLCISHR